MATIEQARAIDRATAERLSEGVAAAFRTGRTGDVFTEDLFLDGHPPYWRFQLQGIEAFAGWLRGYVADGGEASVVRAIPTESGFVSELVGRHGSDGEEMTDRKIVLCEVRDGRVSEMTVYCSGDWDAELRARHAAEAPMIRP